MALSDRFKWRPRVSENETKEEILRRLCRECVVAHLPDEADLFDPVWDAFWNAAGCVTLAELAHKRLSFRQGSAVRYLGAGPDGGGQLVGILRFLSAIGCAAARLDSRTPDSLDVAEIKSVLRRETDGLPGFGAMSQGLDVHGVGILCDWLSAWHKLPPGWFRQGTSSDGTESHDSIAAPHVEVFVGGRLQSRNDGSQQIVTPDPHGWKTRHCPSGLDLILYDHVGEYSCIVIREDRFDDSFEIAPRMLDRMKLKAQRAVWLVLKEMREAALAIEAGEETERWVTREQIIRWYHPVADNESGVVNKFTTCVMNALGESIRDCVLGKQYKPIGFPLNPGGICWCWVRSTEDLSGSYLRTRVGHPRDPSDG